ncbi:MAG: hypothetical protein RL011_2281 [Pseudomonadota bacterium]|jgi:hypothetical protein
MLFKLIRTGVLGFFMLSGPLAEAGELCPKLGQAGLAKLARERGPLKLVFFASWCGECLSHLRNAQGKNTLLIATFDEKLAAERVIAKLAPKSECYLDDGLASFFKVEAVPATVAFSG